MVSRPRRGCFSPPPIFSPFVDPNLFAGYPSAYRTGARHRRCRLRIITSLLLPSPEEAWEPYCSRKPSLTLPLSFSLVSLCPTLSLSAVLLFTSGFFLNLPSSSSSFCLPLRFSIYRVAHIVSRTCHRVLCQFDGNRSRVGNRSHERILRHRMSRQTRALVVTLDVFLYISIYYIGHTFSPSFSGTIKLLSQNVLSVSSIPLLESSH